MSNAQFYIRRHRVRLGSKTREIFPDRKDRGIEDINTLPNITKKTPTSSPTLWMSWPHGSHQRVALTVPSLTRPECERSKGK